MFVIPSDCVLYAVGKPVYHKFTDLNYGAWLKDSSPKNDVFAEKIWATNETYNILYEYANKADYRNNNTLKTYRIDGGFMVSFFSSIFFSFVFCL